MDYWSNIYQDVNTANNKIKEHKPEVYTVYVCI